MKRRILVFIALCVLSGTGFSEDTGLKIRGSLKVDSYVYADINTNTGVLTNAPVYSGMDTLRFQVKNRDTGFAKFEAMVDFYLLHGEMKDRYLTASSGSSFGGMALTADIRKLYVKLKPSFADLTFGRQIIRFGQGFLFSPIDVFSTPDFTTMSFTRRGSDIARVQVPIGVSGEFEGVTTLSTHLTNINSALKLSLNLGGWDTSLVALYRYADYETIGGISFKGDLGVAWHGEAVIHVLSNGNDFYSEAVLGADTSFLDGNLILMAEYYYNDRVIETSDLTPQNLSKIHRQWYARHYGFMQIRYSLDELTGFSANGVFNFPDEAWIVGVQFHRSLYQNVNLDTWIRRYNKNINNIGFLKSHDLEFAVRVEVKF